ncbi:MAG: helix-turn-helix domain-containing protein [Candidatus Zixiibacteriota bacterium]
MGKKYNLGLIRGNRSYSVNEIVDLFNVCNETIRNWSRSGLVPINPGERPLLFLGKDIKSFLVKRRVIHKCPLRENEIYCIKCKTGSPPKAGSLQIIKTDKQFSQGNFLTIIKGECPHCGNLMHRFTSSRKLHELQFEQDSKKVEKGLEGDQLTFFNSGFVTTKK